MNFNTNQIVTDLVNNFVKTVNEMSGNGKQVLTNAQRQEVFNKYKELYERFEHVNLKDLTDFADESILHSLKILGVGLDCAKKLQNIWNLVVPQSDKTLSAVSQFVKSEQCFDLINKNSTAEKIELEKLFGSILGAQITAESMKALKTEKLADIIGYALSGLCEVDYSGKDFEKFQEMNPTSTLGDFFRERMLAHKVNMGVYRAQKAGATHVDVYAQATKATYSTSNKIASANMVDSCFIVEPIAPVIDIENDVVITPGRPGKIVFGLVTSNDDTSSQKQQFLKTYQALQLLVKNSPEYKDYELEPFYLLGGRFRFSQEKSDTYKGMHFEKLLTDPSEKERRTLQQSHFYELFTNCNTMQELEILGNFNPFVCGVDTLDIYTWQQQALMSNNKSEAIWEQVSNFTQNLSSIITTQNWNAQNLSTQTSGTGILELLCKDAVKLTEQLVKIIPIKTTEEYETKIKPLLDNANKLKNKMYALSIFPEIQEKADLLSNITFEDQQNNYNAKFKAFSPQLNTKWNKELAPKGAYFAKISTKLKINQGRQLRLTSKYLTHYLDEYQSKCEQKINLGYAKKVLAQWDQQGKNRNGIVDELLGYSNSNSLNSSRYQWYTTQSLMNQSTIEFQMVQQLIRAFNDKVNSFYDNNKINQQLIECIDTVQKIENFKVFAQNQGQKVKPVLPTKKM